ncbi:uncharacterized protein EAF02_006703 [Botrytis sinoallii]|uniref:uncharacterized protein n=1 Tax=Botrytis sinoallii TaxID=1463999 RepID=UPI001901F776|nr:uncharacterized protein EAF02_006703 [Botrytis sinoallii]KAF7880812.1 hypothetical protein EAF02_006703 [Botrytis sinoallii]
MDMDLDLDLNLEMEMDMDMDTNIDMETMYEVSISKSPSYSPSFPSQQFMSHYPTVAAPTLPIRIPTVTKRVSSNQASLTTSSSSLPSTSSSSKSYKTRNLHTFLSSTNFIILLTIFSSFLITTCSAEFYIEERMVETWEITSRTSSDEGELEGDQEKATNIPIEPQSSNLDLDSDCESDLIKKRNVAAITSTATITPPRSTSTATATDSASSSSTLAESQTSSGLVSAATGTTNLPTPFDSGFTSNITSTCSSFMMDFLANETFKACLPFSLLLQNSNSFFQASKSLVRITQTLDASCSANAQSCSTLMSSIASNITSTTACSVDLLAANPLVTQARLGLLAYSTLFTASCLKDPSNGAYCYAQAVTNSSSPTDSYIYYLPLNTSLPGGSQPTCNQCLKNTMAIFESAGAVRTSAIAGTYAQAAGMVNVQCGPGFVNASLPAAAVVTGGAGSRMDGLGGGMGLSSLLVLWIAIFRWLI